MDDKTLAAAIETHRPRVEALDGVALLATLELVRGSVDAATACMIAGCDVAALVAEAEAWTLK